MFGEDISFLRDEHDEVRIIDMIMRIILFMKKNLVTNVRIFKKQSRKVVFHSATLRLCDSMTLCLDDSKKTIFADKNYSYDS